MEEMENGQQLNFHATACFLTSLSIVIVIIVVAIAVATSISTGGIVLSGAILAGRQFYTKPNPGAPASPHL